MIWGSGSSFSHAMEIGFTVLFLNSKSFFFLSCKKSYCLHIWIVHRIVCVGPVSLLPGTILSQVKLCQVYCYICCCKRGTWIYHMAWLSSKLHIFLLVLSLICSSLMPSLHHLLAFPYSPHCMNSAVIHSSRYLF